MTKVERLRANRSDRGILRSFWTAGCLMLAMGCQTTLDMSSLKTAGPPQGPVDTSDVQGPMQRMLQAMRLRDAPGPSDPTAGTAEFQQAEALYNKGDFKRASKAFKKVSNDFKHAPVREDALFMLAECQYEMKQFSWAQDNYATVVTEYPSTRHLDKVTQRLFTIARTWLDFPQVVTSSDIQPVDFENPSASGPKPDPQQKPPALTRRLPLLPNIFDRSRPIFDTDGRALEALKQIWLHDPTGPLADDALMLTASYHLRKGNNVEADQTYAILREEYPKSPHLQNAFVLGSHVKLMSYQGAPYDGKSLEDAQELKESTLRIFKDLPAADRERQLNEIRLIEMKQAEREWHDVLFWEKKRRPESVAVKCREVIRLYPNSKFADMAREKLAKLERQNAPEAAPGSTPDGATPPRSLPIPFNVKPLREWETPWSQPDEKTPSAPASPDPNYNPPPLLGDRDPGRATL